MENESSLGSTVRDRRLALGYSMGQLATKVDKAAATIRAWEKGDAFPTDEEAAILADALDLDAATLAALLPGEGPELFAEEEAQPVHVSDPWSEDGGAGAQADVGLAEDPFGDIETRRQSGEGSIAAAAAEEATDEAGEDAEPGDDGQPTTVAAIEPPDEDEFSVVVADAAVEATVEDLVGDMGPSEPLEESAAVATEAETEIGDAGAPGGAAIHEALTEAVPVVTAAPLKTVRPAEADLSTVTAEPIRGADTGNPIIHVWETIKRWYAQVFHPDRRWIYRVRFVLLVIALVIMLRILGWAVANLWDALGEVLDSISFSPAETPDVES